MKSNNIGDMIADAIKNPPKSTLRLLDNEVSRVEAEQRVYRKDMAKPLNRWFKAFGFGLTANG